VRGDKIPTIEFPEEETTTWSQVYKSLVQKIYIQRMRVSSIKGYSVYWNKNAVIRQTSSHSCRTSLSVPPTYYKDLFIIFITEMNDQKIKIQYSLV
jgi:hypothetical protein